MALLGLGQLTAVNSVLKNAAGLVRELKKPRVSNEDFAALLQQQIQSQVGDTSKSSSGEDLSQRLISLRDLNNDGVLTQEESGLSASLFERLDSDADGLLSLEELQQPLQDFQNAHQGILRWKT